MGQANASVEFLGRGRGLVVFLTHREIAFEISGGESTAGTTPSVVRMGVDWLSPTLNTEQGRSSGRWQAAPTQRHSSPSRIAFSWSGAEKLRTESNYFIGSDPRRWHARVPHFARAIAAHRDRGVGMSVYGNRKGVEYDLFLSPREDASQLRLVFSGTRRMRLTRTGDLILSAGSGELRMKRPEFYEMWQRGASAATQASGRKAIRGGYILEADGTLGIWTVPRDAGATLVMDPSLSVAYSSFLGGTGPETAGNLGLDSSGNVYIGGTTTSASSFPETSSTQLGSVSGPSQFYIAKINPAVAGANSLVYLTFLGGSGTQAGGLLAIDSAGDAAITGTTTSSDFPVTDSSQPTTGLTSGDGNDVAVSEIDPNGSKLVFSTLFGGSGAESQNGAGGIALDSLGDVYIASDTSPTAVNTLSPDLPVTAGALQTTWDGYGSDAFLAIFQPPATAGGAPVLKYCSYLGTQSSGPVSVGGVAADSSGDAYIAGSTQNSVNMFPAKLAFQASYGGGSSDAFLMKISPAGQGAADLMYATLLGGSGMDKAMAVAVDSSVPPRAYVTGTTQSANFPVNGAVAAYQSLLQANLNQSGGANAFLSVVAEDAGSGATSLNYSTYLGGSATDAGQTLAVNAPNVVYVAGTTTSFDFPWHDNLQAFNGSADAFIARLDPTSPSLASLIYATPLGGTAPAGFSVSATANGIAADGSGHVYLAGETTAANFPTALTTSGSMNGFQQTCTSCQQTQPAPDAFITEIVENSTPMPSVYFSVGSLSFSPTAIGTPSAPETAGLANGGEASLTISSLAILGADAPDFSLVGYTGCVGSPISPGSTSGCSFDVSFTPSRAGPEAAVLAVTDNGPGSPQLLELRGAGQGPHASISPASVSFGNQAVSTTSKGDPVTVTNTGNQPLAISSVAIQGGNAGQFSVQANTCTAGIQLAPGGNCALTVVFAPTATGSLSTNLYVDDNSDLITNNQQAIPLSGSGTPAVPVVEILPASMSLAFGSVATGTTSGAQSVTLVNQGSAGLQISSIAISGTNAPDFVIATTGTTCPLTGGLVAAGANCTVAVQFAPQSTGVSKTASLVFTDNATGSPQQVVLSGTATGTPALQVSPPSLTFSLESEGTASAAQMVTISNTSQATASIGAIALSGENPGDFTLGNPCAPSLGAGKSCQLSVTFSPAASQRPGPRSASLTISNGNPAAVSLSGTAGQAAISIAPSSTSINFGSQTEGASVASGTLVTVTVTNSSSGPYAGGLMFSGVSVTGTNRADFILGSDTCASGSVAPGGTCTIQLTFAPTCVNAPAARSGALVLSDNAPGNPQSIALSGTASGDFCFASPGSTTVSAGQTAYYSVELFSADNFSGALSLSCSGAPLGATCAAPVSVSAGQTFTVSVTTTASLACSLCGNDPPTILQARPVAPGKAVSNPTWQLMVVLVALVAILPRRHSRFRKGCWSRLLQTGALLAIAGVSMAACGGGSASDPSPVNFTPPATYTLTLTATAANGTSRSIPLVLIVH